MFLIQAFYMHALFRCSQSVSQSYRQRRAHCSPHRKCNATTAGIYGVRLWEQNIKRRSHIFRQFDAQPTITKQYIIARVCCESCEPIFLLLRSCQLRSLIRCRLKSIFRLVAVFKKFYICFPDYHRPDRCLWRSLVYAMLDGGDAVMVVGLIGISRTRFDVIYLDYMEIVSSFFFGLKKR